MNETHQWFDEHCDRMRFTGNFFWAKVLRLREKWNWKKRHEDAAAAEHRMLQKTQIIWRCSCTSAVCRLTVPVAFWRCRQSLFYSHHAPAHLRLQQMADAQLQQVAPPTDPPTQSGLIFLHFLLVAFTCFWVSFFLVGSSFTRIGHRRPPKRRRVRLNGGKNAPILADQSTVSFLSALDGRLSPSFESSGLDPPLVRFLHSLDSHCPIKVLSTRTTWLR